MKNAYILDFNFIEEQNLNLNEFITLLHINENETEGVLDKRLKSLEDKGFIKIINDGSITEYVIREKGKLLLDLILIDKVHTSKEKKIIKKSVRAINNELDDFIIEYRNLWKGLKPGSMGSLEACREKMFRWMNNHPSYSKEDILKAAKMYINQIDNIQYLQQADYFIYKKNGLSEDSRLSAFIDEEEIKEDGWSSNLR